MQNGVSHHARGKLTARDLAALGVPCAILAANRSWTAFALLEDVDLDVAHVSRELRTPVVQIWSDDDHGTIVRFHTPDGWSAELPVDRGNGGKMAPADRRLLAELVSRGVLTEARRTAFVRGLTLKGAVRDTWLDEHGVEGALGLADLTVLPVPCTATQLLTLAPAAQVVASTQRAAKPAAQGTQTKQVPVIATNLTTTATVNRAVLALHVHYWTEIFQMNGWRLYRRYKKHLPAERRRDVDELCNLIGQGSAPAEIERAIEAILALVWSADDWDAAIRDPGLATDEGLDPDQLAAWQARLGDAPSTANP